MWVDMRSGTVSTSSKSHLQSPYAWAISHSRLWDGWTGSLLGGTLVSDQRDELYCYRLDDYMKGKLSTGPDSSPATDDEEGSSIGQFQFGDGPLRLLRGTAPMLNFSKGVEAQLHHAFVPMSEDQVRYFVMTNIPAGGLKPAEGSGNLSALVGTYDPDKEDKPVWTIRILTYKGKWGAKEGEWDEGTWKQEEVLVNPPFTDRFHAFDHKGTYAFVTDSGKAYFAPAPAKGKARAVTPIWTDAKRPVLAAVTENATGRTFLFAQPRGGSKGVYFLPEAKPKPVEYDLAKVKAFDKGKGQLKQVVELTRVLVRDKKVALKSAKKAD
jgi:hypothetical protein